jgi:hypothetical protein
MTKSLEIDAKEISTKTYKILTETIARTIRPNARAMPDRTVKGLSLHPKQRNGRGYWYFIYKSPVTKRRVEMVIGHYPDMAIAEAREVAMAAVKLKRNGIDPKMARDAQKAATAQESAIPTFETAARSYIDQKKAGWRNHKHEGQWSSTLETYVFPQLGNRKVDTLSTEDFRRV